MAYAIAGTGTSNFGESDWVGNTYVTTLWVSVLGLPVWPLRSYRIIDGGLTQRENPIYQSSVHHFTIVEELPVVKLQAASSFVLAWSYVAFIAFMLFFGTDRLFGQEYGAAVFVVAALAPLLLMRAWALRKRKHAERAPTGQ